MAETATPKRKGCFLQMGTGTDPSRGVDARGGEGLPQKKNKARALEGGGGETGFQLEEKKTGRTVLKGEVLVLGCGY